MSPAALGPAPFPWSVIGGAIKAADGSTVCMMTCESTMTPRQETTARLILACEAMQKALELLESELVHHRLSDVKVQHRMMVVVHGALAASK